MTTQAPKPVETKTIMETEKASASASASSSAAAAAATALATATATATATTTNESFPGRNGALCDKSNPNFQTFLSRPMIAFPIVVACGYKRIQIPKSGNSFPAFLIAFEEIALSPTSNDEIGASANIEDRTPSFQGIRFAWRSKKDFLRLARKCGGHGAAQEHQRLPKAAMKKIVDETTVPWRRSSLIQTMTSSVGQLTLRSNYNKKIANEEVDHRNLENDNAIPGCLCDPDLPNHFSVRMKKSIWQIDRFLQSMQSRAGNSEQNQNAWDLFCRHSDTEDLVTPKEFVPWLAKDTNTQHPDGQDENEKLFCDLASTTSASENGRVVATTNVTTTALRESSRLGQYFASKDNARKVVECALEKILPLYRRKDISGNQKNILFVEPSCGHGDIVVALVEALKEYEIRPSTVCIIGYDIDPGAIHTCCHRKELFPGSVKNKNCNDSRNIKNDDAFGSNYPVLWECKSFFETTRENCIQSFDILFNDDDSNLQTGCAIACHIDFQTKDRELLVCCLGGPPYTTGPGCGSGIQIDLPQRFVDHCFTKWKADVVSFLLPARYKEIMNNSLGCNCTYTAEEDRASVIEATEATNDHRKKRWNCETHELDASHFFFRGTTKVTQPSIIQVFSGLEEGNLMSNQ